MRACGFDPAPLLAHLERAARSSNDDDHYLEDRPPVTMMAAELAGVVSRRTVHRWRRGGLVDARIADRCAIALGLHPLLLWPDFHDR